MTNPPTIRCKKCNIIFEPYLKTRGPWVCPSCGTKNPNLRRHYRSVADLCILGLIVTAIFVALGFSRTGLNLGMILTAGDAVLLLATIVVVYKSEAPWTDKLAKALIWTVFGLALVLNVVLPLAFAGRLNVPATAVYAIIFSYLFWLDAQAGKCTAPGAPLVAEKEEP